MPYPTPPLKVQFWSIGCSAVTNVDHSPKL
jgi:hypothetical protein